MPILILTIALILLALATHRWGTDSREPDRSREESRRRT